MTKSSQPDSPGKVLIFGRIGTPLVYMIRDFLHRCDIPFDWVELTGDDRLLGDWFRSGARQPGWPLDRSPYYLETSMPGVFAAGDMRRGSVKRCASGIGK